MNMCLVTLGASFGGAKFEVQNTKFEVQNAKFEVQNTKFEVQNVVPVFEFQRSSREVLRKGVASWGEAAAKAKGTRICVDLLARTGGGDCG